MNGAANSPPQIVAEKAGVGGSNPSLTTIIQGLYLAFEQDFPVCAQSAFVRGRDSVPRPP